MTLLPKREPFDFENEEQFRLHLQEDFDTAMSWLPCSGYREEYDVKLNIGQMQLLKEALQVYKEQELSKEEFKEDSTKQYYDAYGYIEYNCDEILAKIGKVQEYIFNQVLSQYDIDHMDDHHCIGGTIQ